MKAAIINYHAGNIRSVTFALERIGIEPVLTDHAEEISSSDKIIFPGVGEASSAMDYLKEKNLDRLIRNLKQPVLGICLGMQLLCSHSEEGDTKCLGIFETRVKHFKPGKLKVPQIGWNTIYDLRSDLFKNIGENEYMYFVHGYYAEKNEYSIATADYTLEYSCALQKDNFYAVQFHPEKSGKAGEQLLKNFFEL